MDGDLEDPATICPSAELTTVAPGEPDGRFGPRDNQNDGHFGRWVDQLFDSVDGSWEEQARARYLAGIVAAPASALADLAPAGMPRPPARTPFPVGEKLACTPGAVVHREEMLELLQYAPATPRVRSRPLLMVPPQLNRHYILDLSPGRSLAEYALAQGIQVFTIVWRNPRSDLGHGSWGLADYLAAQEKAAAVVKAITRSDQLNWLGLCAGGMTLAYMLGQLATCGDDSAGSATFIVTMLASEYPNVIWLFDTPEARAQLEQQATAGQVIPGTALRTLFAWLRPSDLVFNYLVSGWLMGESLAAFDVLAWNDDATRATAKLALEMTRLLVDRSGFPGVIESLPLVSCDSFQVAGYTGHITPWRACYSTTQLLGGDKELCVVNSGHVQSFVNPAGTSRYDYWHGQPTAPGPDEWLRSATEEHGSWWPRWTEWLASRSGPEKAARMTLGSRQYPPLGPAPGTYALS